jgi:hypothetical protein
MKPIRKRRKSGQLIPAAGKTGKMRRKRVKLCDIVVVKAQFFQTMRKRRKRGQIISDTY